MIRPAVPMLAALLILPSAASGSAVAGRPVPDAVLDVAARAAVSEAIGRDDHTYRIVRSDDGRLHAVNTPAGLEAFFDPTGAGFAAGTATAGLSVESVGRGAAIRAVGAAQLVPTDNRVELRRDGFVEWYVNGPAGLQHGLTLTERPAPAGDGAVLIGLRVQGDYRVTVDASGDSASLVSERGPTLRYAGLVAWDADGRGLPARMEPTASGLRLVVDDAGAAYPVVVDPFIQSDEVFPATGNAYRFGEAVAVDGDTMVVGAWFGDITYPGDCENGMAYVFERDGSPIWRLVARLQSSRPDPFCWAEDFGFSVAISGDWIAVGSPHDAWLLPGAQLPPDIVDPNEAAPYFNGAQGSVFLFRRPAGGWADATETEVLTEFDGSGESGNIIDSGDSFGTSVALEGTTLIVGTPGHDESAPFAMNAGTAYVYENPIDAGWERTARLNPSDPFPSERFGGKVAISGDTVVVGNMMTRHGYGAIRTTSAYVYDKPLDGWWNAGNETARLTVEGARAYSVAVAGSTIVVGTSNAENAIPERAFVFEEPAGGWVDAVPNVQLVPSTSSFWFGLEVAADGDLVAVTAPHADTERGEVFLYRRPDGGWGVPEDPAEPTVIEPLVRLQHDDARAGAGLFAGDWLGWSIDVDADTVAVGARHRWHWNVAKGQTEFDSGSAFVFSDATDTTPPTTAIARNPALPSGGAGWDIAPVGITVTAEDDPGGSGVAEIRCAVDPPMFPTNFSELPDVPCPYLNGETVAGNGEHWAYAASVDADGNRSAVSELSIRIDDEPPATLITLDPATPDGADGTYTGPVSVLLWFDSSGGSGFPEVRCVFDPPAPPASFEVMPTTLCGNDFFTGSGRSITANGEHSIWIAARDPAGNVSTPDSRTFTIRRVPTTTITLTPDAPDGEDDWYVAPVGITVTGQSSQGGPVAELRCVLDPPSAPGSFADLPASCPFAGTGVSVIADGEHTVYAASRDASNAVSPVQSSSFRLDATEPQLTCEGTGPAPFTIGATDGELTALVEDETSGPETASVTTTLTAGDLGSPGPGTATLSGRDLAGNEGSVDCAYVVGYDLEILSPAPGAAFPLGTTIPVVYQLRDANGDPIPDSAAALLAGGKRVPCFIDAFLDSAAQRGCPTYAATTDRFTSAIKTPKKRSAAGLHQAAIRVRSPDAPGTTLNYEFVIVELR